MNYKKLLYIFLFVSTTVFSKVSSNVVDFSAQNFYKNITKAANNNAFFDVIYFSKLMLKQYPKKAEELDISFLLGKAYFHVDMLQLANKYLSKYLISEFSPKYYEDAILYKFKIAKRYYLGDKKRLFGSKKMPKLVSAYEDAIKIFDEVSNALPNNNIAIESHYYKAKIHAILNEYKESIEAFQLLIKKYPKHDLAIESYLDIGKVYLSQADPKHQDPALLDLAKINLENFKKAYPKESRIIDAEHDYIKLQEVYAKGLYEIGLFYEKTKKTSASSLYYKKIVFAFPKSPSAKLAKNKLKKLNMKNNESKNNK